ncbi:LysR family transcriptional regulator [Paludibacterium paludis]|uniref:Transcriptional regulator n=1 Tax=Paludibacterium paludis TaxID=1225769 RepID=A0A918NZ28_9NEIS|nr:LysR family transcriptional regulator [Paludibacterium paludis]GGY07775.1 transcriptional regulator [Paludibacterium paludis]
MNELFPRTTLEQWRVLQAIVEHGSYAQAAEALFRSQSAISYTLARLQSQLGVTLLEPDGRRMKLTTIGETLLRDAMPLVKAAMQLEKRARSLNQGWEVEVRLAVDGLYPTALLIDALQSFQNICGQTRVELIEVVLSGGDEALLEGNVDLAIVCDLPSGFFGDKLFEAEFIAVSAPAHPLQTPAAPLGLDDLKNWTQVVVRDSGSRHPRDAGWLEARSRWTVTKAETAIEVVRAGLAFAWLPAHLIRDDLASGRLAALPLEYGSRRFAPVYLVLASPDEAGPAARAMADCFRRATLAACATTGDTADTRQ